MQREISDRAFLGQTVSPYENGGRSSAIDRTASNYDDAKEKVKKISELISTGKHLNIEDRVPKFKKLLKNEHVYLESL